MRIVGGVSRRRLSAARRKTSQIGVGRRLLHFRQLFKMPSDLEENQIGALRVVDEQVEAAVAVFNREAMPAVGEIEPSGSDPIANVIDNARTLQTKDAIADRSPTDATGQLGKMTRAVGCSFINEYHASRVRLSKSSGSLRQWYVTARK
jgi:hypothetical protein